MANGDVLSLGETISLYFDLEVKIKEAFGWNDSWRVLPLSDCRADYWMLVGGNRKTGHGSVLVHSSEPFTAESVIQGKTISGNEVYTQRGHDRWVFRVNGIVLVPEDTQTDGNIFLTLLDAEKEVDDVKLRNLYSEHWGDGAEEEETNEGDRP